MGFGDDDRGQSIQIGAIILFGALIIALSSYQAFVVPDQNQDVEFKHSQAVQDDLQELRSAIVSAADGGDSSVPVTLGTEYPSRAIFLNPGPPSGSLRTADAGTIEIQNAEATGDAGDFWTGQNRSYSTRAIVYQPNYNVYGNAPTTVYENTVLYNAFEGGNLTLSGQGLVDGRSLTMIALNGTLSNSQSGSVSVDIRATSSGGAPLTVTNASATENITLAVATRLSESEWEDLLADEFVSNGGHVVADSVSVQSTPGSEFDRLLVELERNVTYNLNVARVGVGSNVQSSSPGEYLVKRSGGETVIPEDTKTTLTVAVRDAMDNPVSGELVQAATSRSDSNITELAETDSSGVVELSYEAPDDVSGTVTDRVDVSLDDSAASASGSFNSSTPTNVTFSVSVSDTDTGTTAGAGSYAVEWAPPTDSAISSCPVAPPQGQCVVDTTGTFLVEVPLTMTTDPTADGASVSYAVSDRTVLNPGTTAGTTNANGNDTVSVLVGSGTAYAYTSSGSSGDRLELDAPPMTRTGRASDQSGSGTKAAVQFNVTNEASQTVTVTDIYVEPQNTSVARLDDPEMGVRQWASEFYFEVGGDTYTADFGNGESLPWNFDLSEAQQGYDDEPVIGPGEQMVVSMYQFRRSETEEVDMAGKTLDMTFQLANGVERNVTLEVVAGSPPSSNTAADIVDRVDGSSAPDFDRTGSLAFDLTNTGSRDVTIEEVAVSVSGGGNYEEINESGGNAEIEINGGGNNGDYDDSSGYTLGTTVTLDAIADIDAGNTATVELRYFENPGGPKSVDDRTIEFTVYYSDTSSETFSFTA